MNSMKISNIKMNNIKLSSMKRRQRLILTLLSTLCFGLPFFSVALKAQTAEGGSETIKKDVESQQYVSPENRPLEATKRDKVEETQNSGINAGLYLQGLPTISTSAEGAPQFDPLFIIRNHFGTEGDSPKYCDSAAANEASFSCQSDPLLAHGDIKISTLLSGPLLDTARADAVRWFLQNLIDPRPNTALMNPKDLLEKIKDPSKSGEVADALAQQAIISVARQPFAEMIAKRSMTPAGMSMMQKMEQEASQKYLNSDWQKAQADGYKAALTKKSGLEPLYDIAVLEAYRTWLAVEQYKQGERIEALLAAIVVQVGAGAKMGKGIVTETKGPGVTPEGKIKGEEVPTVPDAVSVD